MHATIPGGLLGFACRGELSYSVNWFLKLSMEGHSSIVFYASDLYEIDCTFLLR